MHAHELEPRYLGIRALLLCYIYHLLSDDCRLLLVVPLPKHTLSNGQPAFDCVFPVSIMLMCRVYFVHFCCGQKWVFGEDLVA